MAAFGLEHIADQCGVAVSACESHAVSVYGVEWVFDGTSLDASGSAGPLSATAKANWVTTLAARFGWAPSNNWLWYGKAGGGFGTAGAGDASVIYHSGTRLVTAWVRP